MFNWLSQDRRTMLREIVAEYERDLDRERHRLDDLRIEEAKLRFSMEILEEHGEHEEAQRVRAQLNDAQHRVKAQQQLVARTEKLLNLFRQKLEQLEREQQHA